MAITIKNDRLRFKAKFISIVTDVHMLSWHSRLYQMVKL
jgi:hypothetical protein